MVLSLKGKECKVLINNELLLIPKEILNDSRILMPDWQYVCQWSASLLFQKIPDYYPHKNTSPVAVMAQVSAKTQVLHL
jgi:hypothetical protein